MFFKNNFLVKHRAGLRILCLSILCCFSGMSEAQNKLSQGEHFAYINGIRLHYYVYGHGPVCLLPTAGWGIPIQYIMPLPVFEKRFTVVYYDTRLSGKSTGPNDPKRYSSDDFSNDMDSLRVYLGQPKVYIAGHSMAGFQVLNYAVEHNDKLNGLIVMGGIFAFDSLRTREYSKLIDRRKSYPYFLKHPDTYRIGYAILHKLDTARYTLKETFLLTGAFYTHNGAIGASFFKNIEFNDRVDSYIGTSHFFSKNLIPLMKNIKVPTFIICGDDDFICDHVSQSDRLHRLIPSSKLVLLKDCGHMLWAEQPMAFNAAFNNWFKEVGL
jgi:proline iminopeptidase